MYWTEILLGIGNIVVNIFAIWKIHDLLFPKKPKHTMQDKILDDWSENLLVVRFFAEYLNKHAKQLDHYEQAEPDLYIFLRQEFLEWAKQQKNN